VKIDVEAAREYLAHPSQQTMGARPDNLPEAGVEYYAQGPICAMFHPSFWPGVWMAHYAVKPEGWGGLIAPARALLREFWRAESPKRIIGWTPESNRAALAFSRRLGFVVDGRMPLRGATIIMQGWAV
jgi:hypothetical protein